MWSPDHVSARAFLCAQINTGAYPIATQEVFGRGRAVCLECRDAAPALGAVLKHTNRDSVLPVYAPAGKVPATHDGFAFESMRLGALPCFIRLGNGAGQQAHVRCAALRIDLVAVRLDRAFAAPGVKDKKRLQPLLEQHRNPPRAVFIEVDAILRQVL